jgi:alpha-ketoglutarate-dependent taurine dioxygenase
MHQAFHDHGVIFFRDQQITPEQQPLRGIRHRSTRTA